MKLIFNHQAFGIIRLLAEVGKGLVFSLSPLTFSHKSAKSTFARGILTVDSRNFKAEKKKPRPLFKPRRLGEVQMSMGDTDTEVRCS